MRPAAIIGTIAFLTAGATLAAQTSATPVDMYREWCAVCHGDDGKGHPANRPVRTEPPDFTDCRLTTAETDADWDLVVTNGGPAAGRSADMPAFEMLGRPLIVALVRVARSFCHDTRWPSGNLNFPRPLFTTKAFPEDEGVLQPVVSHGQDTNARVRMDLGYARRVGRRGQVEIGLPAEAVGWLSGAVAGVGDLRLEAKYAVYASDTRQVILTAGLEASLPTGSRRWGFGEGTTVFEPFAALGTVWRGYVIQTDAHALLPVRHFPTEPIRYVTYGAAVLRPLSTSPTGWTAGVELNGIDRNLSLTPEILKGLTRTGSISAAFGVRLSVTPPYPYQSDVTRWSGYLLWDFREPWRARP